MGLGWQRVLVQLQGVYRVSRRTWLEVCLPQPANTHCPFDYLDPADPATSGQRQPLVQVTRQ